MNEKRVLYSFRLNPSVMEVVKEYGNKRGMKLSETVRQFLGENAEEIKQRTNWATFRDVPKEELESRLKENQAICWFGLDFKDYYSLRRKERCLYELYERMNEIVGGDLELLMVPDYAPDDKQAHLHFHGLVNCQTTGGLIEFRKHLNKTWKEIAGDSYLRTYFGDMKGKHDAPNYILSKIYFAKSSDRRTFYHFS